MKKILSIFLSIIMIFGSVACVSVFAENDVNVNMGDFFGNDDPFAPKINVSLEKYHRRVDLDINRIAVNSELETLALLM